MAEGVFIAFEGPDGGGKTGAVLALSQWLMGRGLKVVTTREPGGTEEGLALRKLLLAEGAHDWTPTAELLLVNAARAQHVERVIAPALAEGKIVLCDRFVGSTLAYQGAGRHIDEDTIRALHAAAARDLWPDLTLVLDVDVRVGLKRSTARLKETRVDEGRFESLDLTFHEKVRQSFLTQAQDTRHPHIVIDAHRSPREVQDEICRRVDEILRQRRLP